MKSQSKVTSLATNRARGEFLKFEIPERRHEFHAQTCNERKAQRLALAQEEAQNVDAIQKRASLATFNTVDNTHS